MPKIHIHYYFHRLVWNKLYFIIIIKKKVKVKLTFKVNTVIKPVTQGKNTVVFRPHEYVKRGSYNADTELSEEIFHVVYVAFCSAHRCI